MTVFRSKVIKIITLLVASALLSTSSRAESIDSWLDDLTGHRVIRISSEPGTTSLYFNLNSFTPQGDKLVVQLPDGIGVIDLKNWQLRPLLKGEGITLLFAGRKTRSVYYTSRARDDAGGTTEVRAIDIDTGTTRRVAMVPGGTITSINADETLLLGQVTKTDQQLNANGTIRNAEQQQGESEYNATRPDGTPYTFAEAKERRLHERLMARLPMEIFTIDIHTGKRKVIVASTDWLNHTQFSPTDPQQIMYCHEGPWHEVDRIWLIRTDGTGKTSVHQRTMNMEIAGHEFFSPDGKTVWYDLQTPRGEVFWLTGYNIETGQRHWYKVERNEWSVHYNESTDQTYFSGDGGDSEMVAHAPDGKYLYLLKPQAIPDVADIHAANASSLIVPGTFEAEKLVDMRKQDYRLEPNMIFTPDGKWIIFRGNFEGTQQVYAVEVAKSP